ncbi:MAG: hypothetical protein EPN33_12305 [Acidobacteria bacterium]|nr:MAG: hypothetical protein EPN33_12305 [Acidobacteriota bacterium]
MRAADGQVFAITGLCRQSDFRVPLGDWSLVHLGTAEIGGGEEPYLLVRRRMDNGTSTVVCRIDWEGVFTVLADDDTAAEALFHDLVDPAAPEEVQRQWTAEADTLEQYRGWRQQA